MESLQEYDTAGLKVKIYPDDNPESPREWDNLGQLVCWHGRYTLGDKHDFASPDDFAEWWREEGEGGVLLPVYLYDHGGVALSTSPFTCPWDSGQVGYIFVQKNALLNEGVDEATAVRCMEAEIETYGQYINGEVYGYVIEDEDGDNVGSCWGFYGLDYCISQANDEALAISDDNCTAL